MIEFAGWRYNLGGHGDTGGFPARIGEIGIFSWKWKGKDLADICKFLSTGRYDGPTKSGLAMSREVLLQVIEALIRLQTEISGVGEEKQELERITKTEAKEIVIRTVPPEDAQALPVVDIREYIKTPKFTAFTKKGVRFPWDKLTEVIGLMAIQAQRLGEQTKKQPTLFPEPKPEGILERREPASDDTAPHDPVIARVFPGGPKKFPKDFCNRFE